MDINYVIGIVGVVLAIVGLIASYYFYKKSVRIKEPVYSIKSNNLISGSASTLHNLNISYKKRRVKNLTVSKILFYNRGAETINRQDIATINPLKIASETCTVLDASVLQVNNPANVFKVILEKGSQDVFIDFDYLDKNQGAVIQVVHTGLSSENIGLYGDIKGVEKFVAIAPDRLRLGLSWQRSSAWKRLFVVTVTVLTLLFSIVGASVAYLWYLSVRYGPAGFFDPYTLTILIVFTALSAFPLMLLALQFASRNIPSGLEKFNE
jgi:hypothetical protein